MTRNLPVLTFTQPEHYREDGLCVNCTNLPATEQWCPSGILGYTHGDVYAWCQRCVLVEQIKQARQAADLLPVLETKLRALES